MRPIFTPTPRGAAKYWDNPVWVPWYKKGCKTLFVVYFHPIAPGNICTRNWVKIYNICFKAIVMFQPYRLLIWLHRRTANVVTWSANYYRPSKTFSNLWRLFEIFSSIRWGRQSSLISRNSKSFSSTGTNSSFAAIDFASKSSFIKSVKFRGLTKMFGEIW